MQPVFVRCALHKRLRRLSAHCPAHPEKYPPGTESADKGAQERSAQAYRFGGSGAPESRKQRVFSGSPLRTIPKFSALCTACAASPQKRFCAAPVSAPRGAGRAVPQAHSVLRIAADKTKGQTFPPARGVFHGGNQSPSGRARSCRSFSCASACTSSGKSLSTLFARNRY